MDKPAVYCCLIDNVTSGNKVENSYSLLLNEIRWVVKREMKYKRITEFKMVYLQGNINKLSSYAKIFYLSQ